MYVAEIELDDTNKLVWHSLLLVYLFEIKRDPLMGRLHQITDRLVTISTRKLVLVNLYYIVY